MPQDIIPKVKKKFIGSSFVSDFFWLYKIRSYQAVFLKSQRNQFMVDCPDKISPGYFLIRIAKGRIFVHGTFNRNPDIPKTPSAFKS